MKLFNLKSLILFLVAILSFNSSARMLGQFVGDVQKAAKETGNNIDWKTCENDNGGFNPKHVHKVVDTDNKNPCDPNDSLVKKYKNNFVRIVGQDSSQKSYVGTGFFIDGCKKILTARHTLYEDNKRTKLSGLFYANPSGGSLKINQSIIKEAPLVSTGLVKDDVAVIHTTSNKKGCQSVAISQDIDLVDIKDLAKDGLEFFILKEDYSASVVCAQKCKITTEDISKVSARHASTIGSVEHNCKTEGGNSGSPIFVKIKDQYLLVGVHNAGTEVLRLNNFAPVNLNIINSMPVSK